MGGVAYKDRARPPPPGVPISKTRNQPQRTTLHAHHQVYTKFSPGDERISLSLLMFYAVRVCHMCGNVHTNRIREGHYFANSLLLFSAEGNNNGFFGKAFSAIGVLRKLMME